MGWTRGSRSLVTILRAPFTNTRRTSPRIDASISQVLFRRFRPAEEPVGRRDGGRYRRTEKTGPVPSGFGEPNKRLRAVRDVARHYCTARKREGAQKNSEKGPPVGLGGAGGTGGPGEIYSRDSSSNEYLNSSISIFTGFLLGALSREEGFIIIIIIIIVIWSRSKTGKPLILLLFHCQIYHLRFIRRCYNYAWHFLFSSLFREVCGEDSTPEPRLRRVLFFTSDSRAYLTARGPCASPANPGRGRHHRSKLSNVRLVRGEHFGLREQL